MAPFRSENLLLYWGLNYLDILLGTSMCCTEQKNYAITYYTSFKQLHWFELKFKVFPSHMIAS